MDTNFGFGFDKHMLSPTLNLSGFPFTSGCLNTEPAHRYPRAVDDSTLRNLPLRPDYDFQQSEANKLQNWFCQKPHFQQAFTPALNSEMFSMGRSDIGQQRSPLTGAVPSQKRFLVFNQSGGQTTLLFSSGVPTPAQFGPFRLPNPPTMPNLSKEDPRDISEDEMHEDTEELDALLCSDDDYGSSEDDETSTGHSPSTMTDNSTPKRVEETGEEVDSLSVAPKRRKLLDDRYAASSLKTFACSELESDAESSCGGTRSNQHREELGSKRSRREKIHETVSILQSIIPDANGKDAIVVIDEAIHYLRSLKVKAKALGLD